MKIVIIVNAQKVGFLCSLGKLFESKVSSNVVFIARDADVERAIMANFTHKKNIVRLDKIKNKIALNDNQLIETALDIEKEYNVLFSSLFAQDRGLGQGYFYNVLKVPHIRKSEWGYEKKIKTLVKSFKVYEEILKGCDLLIRANPDAIINSICDRYGCHHFSLSQTRYGDRYIWSNDGYMTNASIKKSLDKLVSDKFILDRDTPYQIDGPGGLALIEFKLTFIKMLTNIINLSLNETKKIVRRGIDRDSYLPFSWVVNSLISWKNFKYLDKRSIFPDEVVGKNFVYMTLHVEPEISLFQYSPEFSNVYEAIVWLSKSLPADYTLVVKEHPICLSVRSKYFYKFLLKIPNVKLAHVNSSSYDWIQGSKLISTITGSVGTEAVYYDRPVVSFGKHQLINRLPSVEYVSNYDETKSAVRRLLAIKDKTIFNISKSCLHKVIIKHSIELPNYKKCNKSNKLEDDMANIACEDLMIRYPSIFK
jgi:hypothetical protein